MKQFKTLLTQLLVIASLMLPWATTAALEISVNPGSNKSTATVQTFEKAGVIVKLGYEKFTVSGKNYRIAPDASLISNDSGRKKFSDFKLGDHIYFKGKILNDVNYVDIIYYTTPETT